jgi:hypothetical protein
LMSSPVVLSWLTLLDEGIAANQRASCTLLFKN